MTLRELQRRMAAAIMLPLSPPGRVDLPPQEAARLIKPNGRLSSLERLQIYRRSYWFRLVNSITEDFPGLEAVLGKRAFQRMVKAYLADRPSCSFTLRDLGSRLEPWLREHSDSGGDAELVLDMVRLEWAHIVAFDGPQEDVLCPGNLVKLKPAQRIGLQPYITLLELRYPVDELRILVNSSQGECGAASHVAAARVRRAVRGVRQSTPERIFLAVHRLDSVVYYRRLRLEEFRLLQALRSGRTIAAAIREGFDARSEMTENVPELLKAWFSTWSQFGWLAVPPGRREKKRSS
ncbi:MAG: putative DNA-binding domain-containing protein [Acidobacteria bacterium]|nr:putative DNA-binding domain-containing protein [Acidobacteriota bacterium]